MDENTVRVECFGGPLDGLEGTVETTPPGMPPRYIQVAAPALFDTPTTRHRYQRDQAPRDNSSPWRYSSAPEPETVG